GSRRSPGCGSTSSRGSSTSPTSGTSRWGWRARRATAPWRRCSGWPRWRPSRWGGASAATPSVGARSSALSATTERPGPAVPSLDAGVDAGGHESIDPHRLRDVLEMVLPGVLEDILIPDPRRGLRADLDLAAACQPGDARGEIRRGPGGGEGPAPAAGGVELRRSDQRRSAVDPHVDVDGRIGAGELLVELRDPCQQPEGGAG